MPSSTITIKVNGQWNGSELEKAAKALGNLGAQAKSTGSVYTSNAQRIAVQTASLASSITSNMARSGTEYVKLGQSIEQVGQKMSAVGQSLTTHVTMPMLAVGTYAGAMAVQYDTAMANVRKVTDMTESQLEALGDSAIELSKTQPVTAEQILNIEALGAQLGVADSNLESFAKVVSGLDIATNLNSEQAATELAQFANITKMSETEYQNLGSTLVALGNNLATTEKDIMNMGMRLAAAGDIAGMSEAEILGLSGAMSSLGIRAEAGGSAMTTIISKISKAVALGGEDLEAFAETAGMSADEFAAKWQASPMDALTALLDGMKALDDAGTDMNVTLENIGINEIRQSDAMRRLASNTDLLKSSVDLATGAWRENTALTDEVSQRNESMASRLQVLKNQVDAIAIQVGGQLVEALIDVLNAGQPIIETVADLAQKFADLDEESQRNVIATAALVAGFGPLTSVLGDVTQGIGKAVQSYGHLKQNIAVLGDALNTLDGANIRNYKSTDTLAGKIGLAGNRAVSAAGDVGTYVKVWEENYAANKKVESISGKLTDLITGQGKASGKSADEVSKLATQLYREKIEAESTADVTRNLMGVWDGSVDKSSAAGKAALEYAESLKETSEKAVPAAQNTTKLQNVMGTIKGAASTAASGIAGFISSFGPMLAVTAGLTAVGYIISDLASRSAEAAERQSLLADAGRTFGEISAGAAAGAQSQAEGISDLGDAVNDTLQGLADLNQQAQETMDEFYVNSATLETYVGTINELADKSGLTATEQERLKVAVQGYNEITGQSVSVTDAANGKLSEGTDAINKNAEAWKRNAEAQAYQQLAVEYTKKQVEAELELSRAQEEYSAAQAKVNELVAQSNVEQEKYGYTTRETALALGDATAKQTEAKEALDGAKTAYDSASESVSDLTVKQALLRDDVQATSQALTEIGVTSIDVLKGKFDELSVKLTDAGVSTETLNAVGSANFQALATACGGNVDAMVWALQTFGGELNAENATMASVAYSMRDQLAGLSSATGLSISEIISRFSAAGISAQTLSGITASEFDAMASSCNGDIEAMIQKIIAYNGTDMDDKDSKVTVKGNGVDGSGLRAVTNLRNAISQLRDKNVSVTVQNRQIYTTLHDPGRGFATGGIRLNAAGGYRLHAAGGAIATRATPLDIVGEDGAEAIVPLTNERYAMPFVNMIADAIGKRSAPAPVVNNYTLYLDGSRQGNVTRQVMEAVDTIFSEYNLTSDMGVM